LRNRLICRPTHISTFSCGSPNTVAFYGSTDNTSVSCNCRLNRFFSTISFDFTYKRVNKAPVCHVVDIWVSITLRQYEWRLSHPQRTCRLTSGRLPRHPLQTVFEANLKFGRVKSCEFGAAVEVFGRSTT
jgi:hypothetical protein